MERFLIIDDDQKFMDDFSFKLKKFFENFGQNIQIYKYSRNNITKEFLNNIDMIFIDIELGEDNGIEFAKRIELNSNHRIVFVSNKGGYIFNAICLQPYFFIRKYKIDQDLKTLSLLYQKEKRNNEIVLHKKNGDYILKKDEILLVESLDHDLKIITTNEVIMYRGTMQNFFSLMKGSHSFLQIHKSFIINADKVKKIENKIVVLSNDLEIPIGKKYSVDIKRKIMEKRL